MTLPRGGRRFPVLLLCLTLIHLQHTRATFLPGEISTAESSSLEEAPETKGWRREEGRCILRDTSGQSKPSSVGPFSALLTLASDGSLRMFEPVHLEVMCPAHPSGLLHVPCFQEEPTPRAAASEESSVKFRRYSHWEEQASASTASGLAAPFTRPVPDLDTPLMLDRPRTKGFLERLFELGMRRIKGQGILSGASNQVADIYRWLSAQMQNKRPYEIDCGEAGRAPNLTFSYLHFWGGMLQAYYASKDVAGENIPNFGEGL